VKACHGAYPFRREHDALSHRQLPTVMER
jgi:hypothetical protein